MLLALVLSAQGLGRATNYQSASALYVYAPLLLTLCIWLLVVNAAVAPPAVIGSRPRASSPC